mmetsp:Transcript_51542/g.107701  ORF Transcript_51542/g.107701 Transcript_51542/m.107701 type:complete len:166 (-) Transcript_51542:100-597(-)
MKIPPEHTKADHRDDGVEATPHTTRNPTADIPVVKGPKGLCYDIGKVADEGRRKRILANRESAKSSRQRRLNEARAAHDDLARLDDENRALREANIALQRRITETQAVIERFHSFAAITNLTCASMLNVLPPLAPAALASLRSEELLYILRRCSSDAAVEKLLLH